MTTSTTSTPSVPRLPRLPHLPRLPFLPFLLTLGRPFFLYPSPSFVLSIVPFIRRRFVPWQYGRWKISQNFRRLMDNSERQVFNGPPETPKEHIFAAVRSLRDGDWRTCSKCIFALDRIWALVSNADAIKTDLLLEIKKSALRTYLFSYSTHYDSMSLDELINEFEMSSTLIHSIISKMMIAEELPASWDQPTNTIVLYKREPSKLQELALQYVADSGTVGPLSRFVSSNEQALNDRMGNNDQNNNQRGGRGNWNRRNTGHRRRW